MAVAVAVAGLSVDSSAAEAPPTKGSGRILVYTGVVDAAGLDAIIGLGIDRHEVGVVPQDDGLYAVEVILSDRQADALARGGVDLAPTADSAASRESFALAEPVFRPYSGPDGLHEEMVAQAAAHPSIAQLHVIGKTVNGQDIVAVRVTKNPAKIKPGKRPATVYIGAQHAREWITPEMVRRLLDHVLTGYGTNTEITSLIDTNELWFVPVANPDGYDLTFSDPDLRLWRKNARDTNGDGFLEAGEGVDLNRNFPTRWGYDNEGSSPDPFNDTYRGSGPASEPETQAQISLFNLAKPEFLVNYHSAAELLLYGVGWQVDTPSPDDVVYEAMAGDDVEPGVPGYDPDLAAELYTVNGDTDDHAHNAFGILSFTPEMSTCETASAINQDDAFDPNDCGSVFEFPDDEALIQQEFEKNLPFALAVAQSATDPDDPVSLLDRDTENFRVDSFDVSYGDPQTVAVIAKRTLKNVTLNYRIDGGKVKSVGTIEWNGGERFGEDNDHYYAELRGTVQGAQPGQSVEVWFTANPGKGDAAAGVKTVESEHFTYNQASDSGREVLVIANEDTIGVNPTFPPATSHLAEHLDALAANGVTPDVWDVDTAGVPHDLGVLSHYDAVVWYLGENRLTADADDELFPDTDYAVDARQHYLTMEVRDFLNEGGKLSLDGETTGYHGTLAGFLGGIWYGQNGAPDEPCAMAADPFTCLLLTDDFFQYYLGAYSRNPVGASGVEATAGPTTGQQFLFGGDGVATNPVDEAGAFAVTSDVLPVSEFPQFASASAGRYLDPVGPFIAVEGNFAMTASHTDGGYKRLSRTYDLTGIAAADAPTFEAQLSYAVELDYDHVIVEVRHAGEDDWTTLADLGGATAPVPPAECEAGFLLAQHPNLERYLTNDGTSCVPTGTSGAWNSFTGSSGGWIPVAFSLADFAGGPVEVVVSVVTDIFVGDVGVLLDDTKLVTTAGESEQEGFEEGLGSWTVLDPPDGSPAVTQNWERAAGLGGTEAVVITPDSVLLGFGLEQLASADDRSAAMGAILDHLGV